ncbi:MAG: diacylglycerol kinase family lipid kinase [Calditrichaeota bacterium]|nr:MAG: diacylglycerol kinase family lipid kinase [Calditrichota bacterium]
MVKPYLLIANPVAGRGRARKLIDPLRREVTARLGEGEVVLTQFRGHACQLARQAKHSGRLVIAAGGDGTIHEVVNGLVGGNCRLAIIPIGSGNDFVKMLNLPLRYQEAVKIIQAHRTCRVDVGRVNNLFFPNGLGVGFDAMVVKQVERIRWLKGFPLYLLGVLRTLVSYRNRRIRLIWEDGRQEERCIFLLAVGNGRAMGGGFYLTPKASLSDGLLDVCVIRSLSRREALINLPRALNGSLAELPQVSMAQVRRLRICSEQGVPVHADGELVGLSLQELDIEVLPAALEVVHNLHGQEKA